MVGRGIGGLWPKGHIPVPNGAPVTDGPNLDDVIQPEENVTRDRTQHAKDPHPSDEVLEHRTEQERQAVGSDDADPAGAEEHAATD
jgi:hypothetical protein